jgi:hypothetical protein
VRRSRAPWGRRLVDHPEGEQLVMEILEKALSR